MKKKDIFFICFSSQNYSLNNLQHFTLYLFCLSLVSSPSFLPPLLMYECSDNEFALAIDSAGMLILNIFKFLI